MRWPWSTASSDKDDKRTRVASSTPDWSDFAEPRNIVVSVALTASTLALIRFYKHYLRRIPNGQHIKPSLFRRRSLFGTVTSVGDGDGFRFFHTPGGRLTGWGWLPGRRVPTKREGLKDNTISVRIAGVDAPEMAHFGAEKGQPYAEEAIQWLKDYILNRRVRIYIYRSDQYERVLARAVVRKFLFRRDVGLEMLRAGLATVYEAKTGSEFGGYRGKYQKAESIAKQKKIGVWSEPSILGRFLGRGKENETPREYKTRTAAAKKQYLKEKA